jgi:phenylacetate-coenzyme A ligase PaaK-like adenylate-forming protein
MDELRVRAEAQAPDDRTLSTRIAEQLKRKSGLRTEVELCAPGSLSRTDLKSRRVRDERFSARS